MKPLISANILNHKCKLKRVLSKSIRVAWLEVLQGFVRVFEFLKAYMPQLEN
jgi:hypothetical protein